MASMDRLDVDEQALRRVRHRGPGKAAIAAGGELPPEARHVHNDVCTATSVSTLANSFPGQMRAAAERHEAVGRYRRRVLEPRRVEPAGVREDGRVPVRTSSCRGR